MNKHSYHIFGERVRQGRNHLGLTQKELAVMLGVTSQHISAIERGKRSPSLDSIAKIARELGVTVDYLICGEKVNNCVVASAIPAIKADTKLESKVKKVLVALVEIFYGSN
jgi:transcriptional regulator with XRE-family HTH domain